MGDISRSMALLFIIIFLIGTAVGSILPEFGTILADFFDQRAHKYNIYFFILGILGIVLSLYLGYKQRG